MANMLSDFKMPSANTIVSTAASLAASAMVIRSITRDLIPPEFQHYIFFGITNIFRSFSSELTLVIEEFDGLSRNQIYKAAEVYLGIKIAPSTKKFFVSLPEKETKMSFSMNRNEEIVDEFKGAQFKWSQITREVKFKEVVYSDQTTTSRTEHRSFELRFHKKHKEMVLTSYFPFLLEASRSVQQEKKTPKLHTLHSERMRRYPCEQWQSITLNHPATFDTLAMDTDIKKMVMDDLDRFVKRRDHYKKVGKAWKRGYLLYGQPGTGKSSLIAAMANHLNFDIYDLELTGVSDNSALRGILLSTGNRSIVVVEDIDCSLELKDRKSENELGVRNFRPNYRESQVTLSGLLNFIDGLWSSVGDERIIVFTTNHKERLDPALLRPGRMDVHVHMSYCTPCGFKTLAANYLGLDKHPSFTQVEKLLVEAMVTPAEIGEQLLKGEDPDVVLKGLIEFLEAKKKENDEKKLDDEKKQEDKKKEEDKKPDDDEANIEIVS